MVQTVQLMSSLASHSFVKAVFHDAIQIQDGLFDSGDLMSIEAHPTREATELEYFHTACGFSLAHLLTRLDQLVKIPGHIAEYSRTRAMARYGVTRLHDLSYHYENFIIRVKSVDDFALSLCNSVFHLGLQPRSVSYSAVVDNLHVKASETRDTIVDLHNHCNVYAEQRNQVIHQHALLDPDLRHIELMLNF